MTHGINMSLEEWLGPALYKAIGEYLEEELGAEEVDDVRNLQPEHIEAIKSKLKPHLRKQALEWADVVPALEEIESIEELKAVVDDPVAFLARLAAASGPAADPQPRPSTTREREKTESERFVPASSLPDLPSRVPLS